MRKFKGKSPLSFEEPLFMKKYNKKSFYAFWSIANEKFLVGSDFLKKTTNNFTKNRLNHRNCLY